MAPVASVFDVFYLDLDSVSLLMHPLFDVIVICRDRHACWIYQRLVFILAYHFHFDVQSLNSLYLLRLRMGFVVPPNSKFSDIGTKSQAPSSARTIYEPNAMPSFYYIEALTARLHSSP